MGPCFDAGGRLYVSDCRGPGDVGPGLFRFEPDGSGGLWSDEPFDFANGLALAADGALYQPSAIVRVEPGGSAGVVCEDPDAHLLCHPTNIAFRGDELLCANLGRWHLTAIEAGVGGIAVPPGGMA